MNTTKKNAHTQYTRNETKRVAGGAQPGAYSRFTWWQCVYNRMTPGPPRHGIESQQTSTGLYVPAGTKARQRTIHTWASHFLSLGAHKEALKSVHFCMKYNTLTLKTFPSVTLRFTKSLRCGSWVALVWAQYDMSRMNKKKIGRKEKQADENQHRDIVRRPSITYKVALRQPQSNAWNERQRRRHIICTPFAFAIWSPQHKIKRKDISSRIGLGLRS